MIRLTAHFWVQAYLARLRLDGIPAFVVAKGEPTAGAVLVKLNMLNGSARCYQRSFDPSRGRRIWMTLAEGKEDDVDASLHRQREIDPDLWIIEVEDRRGRHFLHEPGFED
ncbi:MAG: DUF1491 family protein [Pseudomonadota bacterium]